MKHMKPDKTCSHAVNPPFGIVDAGWLSEGCSLVCDSAFWSSVCISWFGENPEYSRSEDRPGDSISDLASDLIEEVLDCRELVIL